MNAFQFGAYVKHAFDMNALGTGALGGGAVGAGLGGLYGLINPGRDERGNRKSRLSAALRGALGGGAVGAAGGAALGHLNPEMVNSLSRQARGMYDSGVSKLNSETTELQNKLLQSAVPGLTVNDVRQWDPRNLPGRSLLGLS